ncbi:MAG: insulinase family protein [Candidatus Taylorbacteria bacterium]|nr:insulinase family protein [Candidatus Taylorbacteria bacterium]
MKFSKHTILEGLRVVTVPMKDNPTVTVLVMVEAGSKYETKEISGLSHFLEHMCFKGTVRRPRVSDISRELDSLGSQYNAFTSQEYTGYYAKADYKHTDKILDIVSDLYLNPTFPEKEIEKEKGVIIEEINMYQDLPQRHVQDLFMKLLYGDQPAGWNIAGSRQSVSAMNRENFLSYRDKHYVQSATVVIVAGRMNEAEMVAQIRQRFAEARAGRKGGKLSVREEQSGPVMLIEKRKTDQTHLAIGVRTFGVGSPFEPVLAVLNVILGGGMSSRLFLKLRDEMGVGYYVRSFHDPYTDHGYLQAAAGVDKKRLAEVIGAITGEFRRFKDEVVLPEELKKGKDYFMGNLYLSLESSDALAEYYGFQEILKGRGETPDEVGKKIAAVTAEDVKRAAGQIFGDDRLNLAVVGDVGAEAELRAALTLG